MFGVPLSVCYTLGYLLACVSPSVIVPSLISLVELGYGRNKGIPLMLVAAGTFEDIIAIVINGICQKIAFQAVFDGASGEGASIFAVALSIIGEVVMGFVVGMLLGAIGYTLNWINHPITRTRVKFFYCILISILFPVVANLTHYTESKYIGCLFFGYMLYQMWEEDKPNALLAKYWFYIQPLLFATTGAALLFSQISPDFLFKSLLVIFAGLLVRLTVTVLVTGIPQRFTIKERIFIAVTWMPKATVQAALCSAFLTEAKLLGASDEFIYYGTLILSTAVVAIVACAPAGAILMNTLGPKFLSQEFEDLESSEVDDEEEEDEVIPRVSIQMKDESNPLH